MQKILKVVIELLFIFLISASSSCHGQSIQATDILRITDDEIETGAQQRDEYYPLIEGKSLGIVANHSSLIGTTHLVDQLHQDGHSILKIFGPEHGFRGKASDGELIKDGKDPKTGIPVISLYSKHKKPSPADLEGIELMIFDIQDVGVRFYTYLSTLVLVMEACAENNIPLLLLDRPNPNGFYVDGPVLDTAYRSFIGMLPIPIVHGMTMGEMAGMINGEGWLSDGLICDLSVAKLKGYTHNMLYKLPIRPSPNLPNWQSVYLYPSIALFEGTFISVGRGTETPFQVIGHPEFLFGSTYFVPESNEGSKYPPHEGVGCYGTSLNGFANNYRQNEHAFTLHYLMSYYDFFKKDEFFNAYFEKLAGNGQLRQQIESGMSEEAIRESWKKDLDIYKENRNNYLLYPER